MIPCESLLRTLVRDLEAPIQKPETCMIVKDVKEWILLDSGSTQLMWKNGAMNPGNPFPLGDVAKQLFKIFKKSGQISIIPKPECFGDFGEDFLTKPPFGVTSAEVAIIFPEKWRCLACVLFLGVFLTSQFHTFFYPTVHN